LAITYIILSKKAIGRYYFQHCWIQQSF